MHVIMIYLQFPLDHVRIINFNISIDIINNVNIFNIYIFLDNSWFGCENDNYF